MTFQLNDSKKTKEQLIAELEQLRAELNDRKQIEEDLRRSNALWQAQQEASVAGIWVVNEHREVIFYNQRFCQIWQVPPSIIETNDYWQILGTALTQLKDVETFLTRIEALYRNPEEISHDEIFLKDGRVLERHSAPLRSPLGKYYGRVWHFQDITQRKQAEEDLHRSNALLESQREASIAGVLVINEHRDVVFYNQAFREIWQLPQSIIDTQDDRQCLEDSINHLKDPDEFLAKVEYLYQHPEKSSQDEIFLKDERVLDRRSAPMRSPTGDYYGRVWYFQDITKRKWAEADLQQYQNHLEALVVERTTELNQANQQLQQELQRREQVEATLRESERRWRTLMDDVRLLVVGFDTQMTITYANPFLAEVTGYSQAELVGRNWLAVFAPSQQPLEPMEPDCLVKVFQVHHQDSLLTKAGEVRQIAWNCTLLRNAQGDAIGFLSIGEDVTERSFIERMKDEFISVVSHEFRTPLTAIHGALDLISDGLVELQSDRAQQLIAIASEGAERLVYLVDTILDLERLESGNVELVKQPCNIADLMARATDLMQLMAESVGINLVISPLDLQLHIDRDLMLQLLTNLLSNAIKFSPSSSTIWLSAELQGVDGWMSHNVNEPLSTLPSSHPPTLHPPAPYLLLSVKDQGRGIPSDKLETIFERFQQVDTSDSRQKGGTGLGLAICRSIVQQHQGRIWADSVVGEGSCFYVMLPMDEPD